MIRYHLIAAADAAAETCETNGKPKLVQEKCPWKLTLFFGKIFFFEFIFMTNHVLGLKTRSDCSWTIILSIFIKKLHRIAFVYVEN